MRLHPTVRLAPVLLLLTACGGSTDVTLYVALDEMHSKQLIEQFTAETGIRVNARFDTEASKTVGLVSAIVEEAARPRCDVFWNNELAHTVRLAQNGLLAAYASPAAATIPAQFKDAEHHWTGFAARARILIVNTERMPDPARYPTSMRDLLQPRFAGQCAVARPLTGTTLTHFAALEHVLGEAEFDRFVDGLFANRVQLLQSNGATMRACAEGAVAFAFTDTDDFHVALTKGHPVAAVFPDQGEGEIGTMLIPNSIALVKGAPHAEAGRRLIDWVLAERVEALLAASRSAQIPVRASVPGPGAPQILGIGAFRAMRWDPAATAADLQGAATRFARRFSQ